MFINGTDLSRQLGSHFSGVVRGFCISRDTQNNPGVQKVIERLESTSSGISEVKLRDTGKERQRKINELKLSDLASAQRTSKTFEAYAKSRGFESIVR
jgi:hypothetical protein